LREDSTSPHIQSASVARRFPGATGDASSGSGAQMKNQLTNISAIEAEQSSRMFDEAGTIVAGG